MDGIFGIFKKSKETDFDSIPDLCIKKQLMVKLDDGKL